MVRILKNPQTNYLLKRRFLWKCKHFSLLWPFCQIMFVCLASRTTYRSLKSLLRIDSSFPLTHMTNLDAFYLHFYLIGHDGSYLSLVSGHPCLASLTRSAKAYFGGEKMVLLKGILRVLNPCQRVEEVFVGLWLFWVSLKIESKQHLSFLLALPSREHSLQTAPPGPPDRSLPRTVVRLLQGSAGDAALFLAQKGVHGQDNEAVSDQCSTLSTLERKSPHQASLSSFPPVTKTVSQVCLPKSGWSLLLPLSHILFLKTMALFIQL